MKRVLLVDDIPEYIDSLETMLPENVEPLRALSAEEARSAIENTLPEAAVIDIRLNEDDPENRDGLELLKWLKEKHSALPVVMISAYREFEFEAQSLALGAAFFVKKPIDPSEMTEIIAKVLK